MKPRAILLTIVAFVLGALAAGSIGVRVIREVGTDEDATSLPQQTTTTTIEPVAPRTYQVDPFETIVSSTSLIPTGVTVANDELGIEYELVTLSPSEGIPPITFFGGFGAVITIEMEDLDHIWPRQWEMHTADGVLYGGPASARARIARIPVEPDFTPSEIESIRITQALAPYPIETDFALSESDPTAEVYPGVTMRLRNITDHGTSAIVQVEIDEEDHELTGFFVTGAGPGWRSAVFQAEGAPVVNLTWVGGDLPEQILLRAIGTVWVPLAGDFEVTLEGVL